MKSLRSVLAAGITVAVSSLPSGAGAVSAPSQSLTQEAPRGAAATRFDTSIRFLRFPHVVAFNKLTPIRGQVIAWTPTGRGSVGGVPVHLLRRNAGSATWVRIARTTTTNTEYPYFVFRVYARQNAAYKAWFPGNTRLQPTNGTTSIRVHRVFSRVGIGPAGSFHGVLSPRYVNRLVYIDKRPCATCGWRSVGADRTDAYSRFSFRVGAPASGRWWWRARVPAPTTYITSYSSVWTTELR
jgi:hypothetical protein